MGEVVKFRRAKLAGFLPDDLGESAPKKKKLRVLPPCLEPGRDAGSIGLIEFAKQGEPKLPDE